MKLRRFLLSLGVLPLTFVPLACAQTPAAPVAQAAGEAPAKGYTFVYRADKKLDSVSVAGQFNNWNTTTNPLQVDADGLTWRARVPLELGKYEYKFVLNGKDWITDPLSDTAPDGSGNSLLTLTATGNASPAPKTTPGNADKIEILTPDKVVNPDAVAQTFVYRADKKLDSVSVAGEFNGWNTGANPLKVDADGLFWRASVPLAPGKYQYKLVVNGDTWMLDPSNKNTFTEANGNVNSLAVVAPADFQKPAAPDDGQTTSSALRHLQSVPYLNFDQGKLRFELRARAGDLSAVTLQIGGKSVPMKLANSNGVYAFYQTEIPWDGKTNLSYVFGLKDGARTEQFGANGAADAARPFVLDAKTYRPFVVPAWVEKTVLYQIFPDRFANGDKSNDPPNVAPWNSMPNGDSRYGGDVAGVRAHLPYLQNLGIGAVYFNPVFKSPSNHRYDATDYKQIDPQFGTNAEFADLTRQMQKAGIATVMDFVFNHTATNFPAFEDVRKNGESSAHKDWYLEKSFPVRVQTPPNYLAWNGFAAMPKLNLTNPATADYMLDLVNYWDKEVPLAGLRLDVADEVDIRFWRQLRARAKNVDPQLWIVGERWGDATPWLQGDQWDSAMNYPFRDANLGFIAHGKISASAYGARLMELYNAYPPQAARAMLNLLSSHDTPRFLTEAGGNAKLQMLAATVQFTWPGAPSIYYGEELGMEGGADPANRRGMEWDKATADNPTLAFYKKLIAIRNRNPALQSGAPAILVSDDAKKSLAFSRTLGEQRAIVVLNRSQSAQVLQVPFPGFGIFVDALGGKSYDGTKGKLNVELAPLSSAILLAK